MVRRGLAPLILALAAICAPAHAYLPSAHLGLAPRRHSFSPQRTSGLVGLGPHTLPCSPRLRVCAAGPRMSDLSDIVARVEIQNALDPKTHSLTERLSHTVSELTSLADAIEADVIVAEEQLAEKKKSLDLIRHRIDLLTVDLMEAKGNEVIESGDVVAGLIVGGGRVGQLLQDTGHPDDVMVRSTSEYKYQLKEHPGGAPKDGPIYLCVPTEALLELIEATPQSRRADLVYMGTGTGQVKEAVAGGTMAAVYFQVNKPGEPPEDPLGLTVASGKWAGDFARRLRKCDVTCLIGNEEQLEVAQHQYLVWLCAVHLVGKMRGATHVSEVEAKHGEEFENMLVELGTAAQAKSGVALPINYVKDLREYTKGLQARVVLKKQRHAYFWDISQEAKGNKQPDPCPLHSQGLKKCKAIP